LRTRAANLLYYYSCSAVAFKRLATLKAEQFEMLLIFATVKIFTFIFSCYILLLSTVPCCTVDNCNDETLQSQTAGKHDHNDGCKNCSPFTLCGNCVGFTITANSFQVDTPLQLIQQTFSGYIQSYLPQYISSFWQPPRLGNHLIIF